MPDKANEMYEQQLAAHIRSFRDRDSEEYRKRKSYPGKVPKCTEPDCLNTMIEGSCQSYWLCPQCVQRSPDINEYHTHVPPQKVSTDPKERKRKVERNNGAAFAAYINLNKSVQ